MPQSNDRREYDGSGRSNWTLIGTLMLIVSAAPVALIAATQPAGDKSFAYGAGGLCILGSLFMIAYGLCYRKKYVFDGPTQMLRVSSKAGPFKSEDAIDFHRLERAEYYSYGKVERYRGEVFALSVRVRLVKGSRQILLAVYDTLDEAQLQATGLGQLVGCPAEQLERNGLD